ncbi:MAG: MarR family transcriptional regulator, partial [Gammaproteobacteria bacterium]|nr:MarR family transcriptional regulator [Gammaproteobacteria bacterium]
QKDLAQFMGIEAPTLVRRLDLLESDGLIERQPSISDRRAKTVILTDRALQVLDAVTHVTDEVRRDILADIPSNDLALCQAVLDRIIENATRNGKPGPRDGGGKDD